MCKKFNKVTVQEDMKSFLLETAKLCDAMLGRMEDLTKYKTIDKEMNNIISDLSQGVSVIKKNLLDVLAELANQ